MTSLNPLQNRRTATVGALLVAAAILLLPTASRAQQVVAFVNGEPVTTLDLAHRAKFLQLSTKKPASAKEAFDSIVDEILEIKEAKRFGLDVPDKDIENSYKGVASRMGIEPDKLTQILSTDGSSADTLKRRLRAQLAWNWLVRSRYKSSLEVGDKDVETQAQLHNADAKLTTGFEYIMRPVVFIVQRGSPEAALEARKREAEGLRGRFLNCTDGVAFARALADVAVRDQVSKFSADLPQQLRDILDNTATGHLTPPEVTTEGVQMFAVCAKKETKTETPEMREIREQMFQQKFGARAKRYLDELRRAAMIEYKTAIDK